jgi:hypothetical protein
VDSPPSSLLVESRVLGDALRGVAVEPIRDLLVLEEGLGGRGFSESSFSRTRRRGDGQRCDSDYD